MHNTVILCYREIDTPGSDVVSIDDKASLLATTRKVFVDLS